MYEKVYVCAHPAGAGARCGTSERGRDVDTATTLERPRARAAAPARIPLGRRSPRGRERWYLLRLPKGREGTLCSELLRLVPRALLSDAFPLRKEVWMKRAGAWRLSTVVMYSGYVFAVSADAAGLARAVRGLTLPVELVGTETRSWAPLSDGAAAWYARMADARHVIRSSTAVIVDGELRVTDGPLAGQEARISKVDRHRRRCLVTVEGPDGDIVESLSIDVPFKS